jgi:hypothetical protein
MSNMMTDAISKGNHPPSVSLSKLEAQKVRSTTKKKPVAAKHNHRGYFQL